MNQSKIQMVCVSVAVFFAVLNIFVVNPYAIFQSHPKNKDCSIFKYMKQLANERIMSHLTELLANFEIPREIRIGNFQFLGKVTPPFETREVTPYKRKRYLTCHYQNYMFLLTLDFAVFAIYFVLLLGFIFYFKFTM